MTKQVRAEDVTRSDEEVRSPDDSLMNRELYEQIHRSVGALPDIYQSVFFLRDIQGYSIKETSEILHTTPAAIKSRLHRSRFLIKEQLDQYINNN